MRISRFWKTLDDFADAAASRWEWQATLGAEFASVEQLLSKAGRVRELPCPSPGGEGCPRRVVRHVDGTIRAVCGDRPKACADLDLDADDITILRVDRANLARRIARALGLSPHQPGYGATGPIIRIGTHDVYAGRGFPVFLALPGPSADADPRPFAEVLDTTGPRLLLTPTVASLPEALIAALDRAGVVRMALADTMIVENGTLTLARPAAEIFAALRDAVTRDAGDSAQGLAWPLPPDARWEEITMRFVADEVLNVTFRGETRRFEPDQLGMKNAKNGKPKAVWTYLKAFALKGGRLAVRRGDPTETSKHQKQKQALSKALRDSFGIADEPIPTDDGDYVTRFVVSADDLEQGRQGQRQRNFVGRH
jgi:hypothetical protein